MNPYGGYQLYQVQRPKARAEILADDARRGRRTATAARASRALAVKAGKPGIMALNAIRGHSGSPASRSIAWPGTRDRLQQPVAPISARD